MKIVRLKNGRKFCRLGSLATSVGWKHDDLIGKLEEKRKARATTYYKKKLAATNNKRKVLGLPEIKKARAELVTKVYSKYGDAKQLA